MWVHQLSKTPIHNSCPSATQFSDATKCSIPSRLILYARPLVSGRERATAPSLSTPSPSRILSIPFIPNLLFFAPTLPGISAKSLHWFQSEEVSMRMGGVVRPVDNMETPAPPDFSKSREQGSKGAREQETKDREQGNRKAGSRQQGTERQATGNRE
jgi:hypothetical protein